VLNYLTKLYELGALPVIRPGATQTLAVGATSAASNGIGADVVRVIATVDVHLAFGAAPVADATSLFLPANTAEYFACEASDKVAAIQDSVGGTMYITPAEE
jgi:hypothetical protein